MRTRTKVIAGALGGVWITAVSFVAPGGMLGEQTPAGVVRPTPSVSPFPAKGTVPVVTPSAKPIKSESASKRPENATRDETRESATPKPKASPSAVRAQPQTRRQARAQKVTTISSYVDCSGHAQSCIDAGKLTKYNPGQVTLAGHNYMGYQWMSRLPVGRKVVITSGVLAGTYKVYGHAWSERARKGGVFPAAGYAASLVLQTCEPNGTGYSLLRRA